MKHTYIIDSEFANRLYEVLINSDMPVKSFSESIGVSKTSMYNYLQGIGIPQMHTVKRICKLYNVSADWLLGLEGMKNGQAGNM